LSNQRSMLLPSSPTMMRKLEVCKPDLRLTVAAL
jgi:hypothetical protein